MRVGRRIAIGGAVALAAALLAVVLTAVIGPSESELARAADRLQAQNTAGTIALGMSSARESFAVSGRYVQNARGTRGRVTGSVTIPSGRKIRMVVLAIGGQFWMRYPNLRGALPRGYRWIHMVDRNSVPESMTPSQFAHFLADADDVSKVGEDEPVGGTSTTHYRGAVDVGDVAEEIGGQTEQRFDRLFHGAHVKLPIEAWIGHDGLPRRIRLAVRMGANSLDMTMNLLHYGVKVDVQPPPAGSVIEEKDWNAYTRGLSPS